MASLWTKNSSTTIATLPERQTTSLVLPLRETNATTTLISGNLPTGMRLENNTIFGTPFQVARETNFKFVLRATYNNTIEDRTFNIIVQGPDEPEWITQQDLLPVGLDGQYFILDSAPIDFQLEAIDADTAAGQTLEYFIGSRDGQLPPGIELTKDGRLVGVVDPILAIEKVEAAGYYDDAPYDYQAKSGFDWSVRPNNGYDSFYYDTTVYGKSIPTRSPKKLNRFYQFTVSVSDGDTISKRTFRIYVVGDDFFRSDTTVMQCSTGVFTADVTHLRKPIWITPRDFGYRRANNYVTLKIDIIDPNSLVGIVVYNLASTNDDGSESILPPGLSLDSTNGEVAGYTPYQPAVTKEYKFTITAKRIEVDDERIQFLQFAFENTPINTLNLKVNKLGEYADRAVGLEFTVQGITYKVNSINTANSFYDVLNLNKPTQHALVKGDTVDLGVISVTETESAQSSKTFVVKLLGEIDSTIQWLTPENLGQISSNYISTLSVSAQTTVPNARLLYSLESGTLPPGLTLSYDGEIIGKINSFGTADAPGLTVFDSQAFTIDGNTTTIDRNYQFTIKAQDQFGYSAIQRKFNITVADPDDKLYSNLYFKPFLNESKRFVFNDLLNNADIFLPQYIYRPNDPNFGLQKELKMLVYAGIETKNIEEYVAITAKNHSRKKYKLGNIKTAIAKTPGTNDIVYEVVYIEVLDPYKPKNGKIQKSIRIRNERNQLINQVDYNVSDLYAAQPNILKITTRSSGEIDYSFDASFDVYTRSYLVTSPITNTLTFVDRDGLEIDIEFNLGTPISNKYRPTPANVLTTDLSTITVDGNKDQTRYITSIENMRDAIRGIGETEKNFLPLWMRTAQPGSINELGFVNAIPLVYCYPGTSEIIKNSLEFLDFDFNQFDLDIDRYIIDSTTGNSSDQYILFANYKINI